jgi:hypothetical protein
VGRAEQERQQQQACQQTDGAHGSFGVILHDRIPPEQDELENIVSGYCIIILLMHIVIQSEGISYVP